MERARREACRRVGEVAVVKRSGGEPTITKAGSRLDPAYERRLADEAEAGFDLAALTRRHAGRPSLSGRAGHSKRVDLRVDHQTYEAIRRIAEKDHRRVSDVVRDDIRSVPARYPVPGIDQPRGARSPVRLDHEITDWDRPRSMNSRSAGRPQADTPVVLCSYRKGWVMESRPGSEIIKAWPEESREAAQLVIDTYGEPREATSTVLTWFDAGPWKRVLASKVFYEHQFPAPHYDSVESVIDYRVPPEKASDVVRFDGSVIVERTAGEASARCHDEQANFLALNLMHDIVTGQRDVAEARQYYAREFADARRKQPAPYMEKLRFIPGQDTRDPDHRMLSDEDLQQAQQEGEQGSS